MKEITIQVPDGKRAEWVDGVLTLVDAPQVDNRPVTERIKTFDDALRELGEEHDAVKTYRALMGESVYDDAKDILAYLKLRVITAALNDGWQPQFTEDETRWYVWYGISLRDNIEDLDDEDKSRVVGRSRYNGYAFGGLVCACADSASSSSYSANGSRLAFKTEALAEYAGKQFAELYGNYLLNGLQPIE